MTGKSQIKTRVYLSDVFLSPLAGRKSYEESAVDFKASVIRSSNLPRLDADVAVKALSIGEASKANSDGKKRTNKGGIPGVENFDGFRYDPKQKGGPGKVFKLSTTYEDRINPTRQKPNWGWIDDPRLANDEPSNAENGISIRMRKYQTNQRTGEVIEESGVLLDPFSVSGKPAPSELQEKRLPGQSLAEMNPGGGLVSHAARGAGVLTDMDGKLRCPPGTPAANQFTDVTGSNCFGLSSGEIIDGAKKIAGLIARGINELDIFNMRTTAVPTVEGPDGSQIPITGTVRNSSRFWKLFGINVDQAGRVPWETVNGKRQFPSVMSAAQFARENPDTHRLFLDGAQRGRANLRTQKERTARALEIIGDIQSPSPGWDRNSDLEQAFTKLTESGYVLTTFTGRPKTESQIESICAQALRKRNSGFSKLPDAEKAQLIAQEKERYFRAERAMMGEVLNMYISHPEHMRTIDSINWTNSWEDEANANWNFVQGAFGKDSTFININMGKILDSMSTYLPAVKENERLRIDALGGSEAANAQELNDFLVSTYAFSKQTSAMIGGEESFARHIMSHEIMHTMQIRSVSKMISEHVDANGRFTIPRTGRTVSSAFDITNQEMSDLISDVLTENVKLDSFNAAMNKAESLEFLAGKYISDVQSKWSRGEKTFEIMAELGALRAQGIIYGDDIDDALSWMDAIADTRYIEDRAISDAEELQRFEQVFRGATPDSIDMASLPIASQKKIQQAWLDKEKQSAVDFIDSLQSMNEDELVSMLGDMELKEEILNKDLIDNPGDRTIEKELSQLRSRMANVRSEWRGQTGLDNQTLRSRVSRDRELNEKFDSETLRNMQAVKEKAERRNNIENVFTDDELALEYAYLSMPEDISSYSPEEAQSLMKEIRDGIVVRGKRDNPDASTQKILRDFNKRVDDVVTEEFRAKSIAVPGETPEQMAKKVEQRRLEVFTDRMRNSSPDEIIDELGNLEFQREILKDEFAANPKDDVIARQLTEIDKKIKNARSTWIEQTGLDNSILKTRVAVNRDEKDKLDAESLKSRNYARELNEIQDFAADAEEPEILSSLAQIEKDLSADGISPETAQKLADQKRIYRAELRNRRIDSGDTSSTQKLNREIDKQVEELSKGVSTAGTDAEKLQPAHRITPAKDIKSFANPKKVQSYADEERKHLLSQATGPEEIAIRELSDTDNSLAASLLDPEKRVDAIIEIGKNYDELIAQGVSPEKADMGTDADVENQLRHVLIPSLELIDQSSVPDSFEVQTSLNLDESQINADPESDLIDAPNFTSGTLLHGERPVYTGVDSTDTSPVPAGKERHRVVLQVDEGQKGFFPHWSDTSSTEPDDFEQKFVMPPGKIKIVGKKTDEQGNTTLIAKFVEQHDTEKILDSILSGPDSDKIPSGARLKIEKVTNEHIVQRRRAGKHQEIQTPLSVKKEVDSLNNSLLDDIGSDGGSFGFPVDNDYVQKMNELADAPDGLDSDVFGPVTTMAQRADMRSKAVDSTHSRLLESISSDIPDGELQIDPADISPEVKSLIQSSTPQDIEEIIADEAMRIHSEIDPRPRVIVREDELENIIDVGGLLAAPEDVPDIADDFYDIGAIDNPQSGINSLSSGRAFGLLSNRVMRDKLKERLDKTNLSDDQKESIIFAADLAAKYKLGGAQMVAAEAARRGGRELAEFAIRRLVDDGKITNEQASAAMRMVDRVAPEGVPDAVKRQMSEGIDVARNLLDETLTPERIDKAQDAISSAREAVGERATEARDRASRVLSKLRRGPNGKEKEPSVDDVLVESFSTPDPFGSIDEPSAPLVSREPKPFEFDPFASMPDSISNSKEQMSRRRMRRLTSRSEDRMSPPSFEQENDPFGLMDNSPGGRLSSGQAPGSNKPNPAFIPPEMWDRAGYGSASNDKDISIRTNISRNRELRKMSRLDRSQFYEDIDSALVFKQRGYKGTTPEHQNFIDSVNRWTAGAGLVRLTAEQQRQRKTTDTWTNGSRTFGDNEISKLMFADNDIYSAYKAWRKPSSSSGTRSNGESRLSSGGSISGSANNAESAIERKLRSVSPIEFEMQNTRGSLKKSDTDVTSTQYSLSSGREGIDKVSRDLPNGSLAKETSMIETPRKEDRYGSLSWKSAKVHEINGEKIVFGVHDKELLDNNPDVKNVPINPFEISGYSEFDETGRDLADKWIVARMAYSMVNQNTNESDPGTHVDALLYAGARGDKSAMEEFDKLAADGYAEIDKILQNHKEMPESMTNDNAKREMERDGVSDLKLDDLYLVHETPHEIQYDKQGNIILRPAGDYEFFDESGNPIEVYRDTIHFALNHVVSGHMMRQRKQKSNIIMVPLRDVLDANPDSLSTLKSVDTFLVPKPGEPLVLPGAKVLEGGEDVDKRAKEMLKELGAKHFFEGGSHYSTPGVDKAVHMLAVENNVDSNLHANTALARTEFRSSKDEPIMSRWIGPRDLALMGKNARIRLANNNRWTGSAKQEESQGDF